MLSNTCENAVKPHVIICALACEPHANRMWQKQSACEISIIFTCDTEQITCNRVRFYMWTTFETRECHMWKRDQITCDSWRSHMRIACEPHATTPNHMWNASGFTCDTAGNYMRHVARLHVNHIWNSRLSHVKQRSDHMWFLAFSHADRMRTPR